MGPVVDGNTSGTSAMYSHFDVVWRLSILDFDPGEAKMSTNSSSGDDDLLRYRQEL